MFNCFFVFLCCLAGAVPFLFSFIERKELTKQPAVISTNEFKSLLKLTRECFLDLCSTNLPTPVLQKVSNKTRSCTLTCGKHFYLQNMLFVFFGCFFILVISLLLEGVKSFLPKEENMKGKVKWLSRLILQTEITLALPISFLFLGKKIVQKTFLISSPDRFFFYLHTFRDMH